MTDHGGPASQGDHASTAGCAAMRALEDRMRDVRDAIHSVEMEGGQVDQATQEQMAAHARGEISAEQLKNWVMEHVRQIADEEG